MVPGGNNARHLSFHGTFCLARITALFAIATYSPFRTNFAKLPSSVAAGTSAMGMRTDWSQMTRSLYVRCGD